MTSTAYVLMTPDIDLWPKLLSCSIDLPILPISDIARDEYGNRDDRGSEVLNTPNPGCSSKPCCNWFLVPSEVIWVVYVHSTQKHLFRV